MSTAFGLPDLDALDHAALKEMILAQQAIYRAEREKYTSTLNSRTSEIERMRPRKPSCWCSVLM